MSTILDFQIQPLSAESYSLTVCERGSSQPLASATFSHRVDFLTDFSVDRNCCDSAYLLSVALLRLE
jgi:hypothetical protein